jgi:hypothetical protein
MTTIDRSLERRQKNCSRIDHPSPSSHLAAGSRSDWHAGSVPLQLAAAILAVSPAASSRVVCGTEFLKPLQPQPSWMKIACQRAIAAHQKNPTLLVTLAGFCLSNG